MLKVFISSTYADLKDYREAVIEQLRRMRVDGAEMEYFGASENEPTTLSLNELEKCNIYIGIIGHRFGTLSPDQEHSITEREYMRARELFEQGAMRCLIYLADEKEVRLLSDLFENDDLRKRQQHFRQSLMCHTPRKFRSPTELAAWVAADLYNLDQVPPIPGIEYFDETNWNAVIDRFGLSDMRIGRIQHFLDFLAARLSSLVTIDPQQFDKHPLFDARNELRNIIPGVSLDDEGGILKRTGVRHVILRQETAVLLLQRLDDVSLAIVGEQIGRGAASDLIQHTIEKKRLIPASAEAFIMLWDFWDRTGGWGKFLLLAPSTAESSDTAHVAAERPPEWLIRIENNFLHVDDINETHRLCSFWCGYLKGVLNEALPRITQVMTKNITNGPNRPRLPAYHRVVAVTHEPDEEPMIDVFRIHFEREALSSSLQILSDAYRQLGGAASEDDFRRIGILCRYAIEAAKTELVEDFERRFRALTTSVESGHYIAQMLDPTSPLPQQRDVAEQWFNSANELITALSRRGKK